MTKKIVVVVLVILIFGIAFFWWVKSAHGFSAREQPSKLESVVARGMRALAIPRSAKNVQNPMAATPELLVEARHHFADHCAACHANDGSGNTEMGRNLYP